jgi:hypothetical protein
MKATHQDSLFDCKSRFALLFQAPPCRVANVAEPPESAEASADESVLLFQAGWILVILDERRRCFYFF